MKIQVMHDHAGKIYGILVPVEGGRRGHISSPDANMTIVEVEAPDNLSTSEVNQNEGTAVVLSSLMQDFVVDSGCLVKRSTIGVA